MKILAEFLHNRTYDKDIYEPIRADFLEWYQEFFCGLKSDLNSSNSDLMEMALNSRTEAREYEPDNKLYTAVQIVDETKEIVSQFAKTLSKIGSAIAVPFLGGSVIGYSQELIGTAVALVFGLVGSVAVIPLLAYPLFSILVNMNSELIQKYNRELVLSVGEIRYEERRRDELLSYYVFHSSLCSTTKQGIIVFLGVLRYISPRTYHYIKRRIAENVREHRDDNISRIMGREYELHQQSQQVQNQSREQNRNISVEPEDC